MKEQKCIDEFNATHKYKKRSLAMVPLKFCIAFTFSLLNHVYKDGTNEIGF